MAASNATSSASSTPSCPTLRQRQPFRSQPKEPLDRYRSINALAEAFDAFYKTELTKRCGPWRDVEHLEAATMAYIVWFNHKRLNTEIGDSTSRVRSETTMHTYGLETPVQPQPQPQPQPHPLPDAKDRSIELAQ